MKFKTLQLAKEEGTLALPCMKNYYKAAQLCSLYWCDANYESTWKEMEQKYIDIPLRSVLGNINLQKKYFSTLNKWRKVHVKTLYNQLKNPSLERNARIL